jgi:hypothetical protein
MCQAIQRQQIQRSLQAVLSEPYTNQNYRGPPLKRPPPVPPVAADFSPELIDSDVLELSGPPSTGTPTMGRTPPDDATSFTVASDRGGATLPLPFPNAAPGTAVATEKPPAAALTMAGSSRLWPSFTISNELLSPTGVSEPAPDCELPVQPPTGGKRQPTERATFAMALRSGRAWNAGRDAERDEAAPQGGAPDAATPEQATQERTRGASIEPGDDHDTASTPSAMQKEPAPDTAPPQPPSPPSGSASDTGGSFFRH